MDFFELINNRESCRNYDGRAVDTETLKKCVGAVRLAPSACNGQPWHFTIVNSAEKVDEIRAAVQGGGLNGFTKNCKSFIVVSQTETNLSAKFGGLVKKQDFPQIDIGIAVAHFVLAAADLGVSTCIMGWFDEKKLKEALDIKPSARVRLVIAAGYSAGLPLREKRRKALDEICAVK